MNSKRLTQQLEFLKEIDKLKTVFRQTNLIADQDRFENTAEHSWHIAMYGIILMEYANETVDALRVLKMLLIHDIVEIDAGDTFIYDDAGLKGKLAREQRAADRLYNLLPEDQAKELRALWDDFEHGQTIEAKFASALDRLQPLIHNYASNGGSWQRHKIIKKQVELRVAHVANGSQIISDFIDQLLDDAVAKEMLLV